MWIQLSLRRKIDNSALESQCIKFHQVNKMNGELLGILNYVLRVFALAILYFPVILVNFL
jgi:hypothetical protein